MNKPSPPYHRKPRRARLPMSGDSRRSRNKIILDSNINSDTIDMAKVGETLKMMEQNPKGIRFLDLCKVCDHYFGDPRQKGSSHRVYKTPWQGDPRVNIQNTKGKAKAYQVKQVLNAVRRLEYENPEK